MIDPMAMLAKTCEIEMNENENELNNHVYYTLHTNTIQFVFHDIWLWDAEHKPHTTESE